MYLDSIGIDVDHAVKLIVVSHWHDDHIRGVAETLVRAKSATVAWSIKYDHAAFFRAIETARSSRLDQTGFTEMSRILEILMERRQAKQPPESVGPLWAGEGTVLFQRTGQTNIPAAQVMALSPSHGTQTLAMHELQGFLPVAGAPQRKATRVTPNQRSVVLSILAGNRSALLGADLENSPNPATGWRAVVSSPVRPQVSNEVFKAPHHGSQNAHNEGVWTEMLDPEPIVCLTPFLKGRKPLPSPDDIDRLLQRSTRVFCTCPPRTGRPRGRSSTVDRTIREVARRHRVVEARSGHIRIRGPLRKPSSLEVDLYGPAYRVG